MVNRTSTLLSPRGRWVTPLGKDERMWFAIVIVWAIAMFLMIMFIWPRVGNEQTTFESYRVQEQEFARLTQAFVDQNATGENIGGIPVVAPPPGDVYLLAQRYQFRPIVQLQRNQTYRLLLSSFDVQHGFSLQPDNVNFQVLPGYVMAIELTPEEAGEYTLVCNEFCGPGHHLMLGRIIVTE